MIVKKHEDLRVYNLSMEMGQFVWNIVCRWAFFEKETMGRQCVKSADSIAANIAEGFGRYHFKENKNFNYYSRGSLAETQVWLQKAYERKLVTNEENQLLCEKLKDLSVKLNNYLNTLGKENN